ncbi:MAG TPA: hypothetical protein VMH47_03810 [Gaiellaceae bacterium]|nr:hypothetical protein [Gaiellaceae bacterium]
MVLSVPLRAARRLYRAVEPDEQGPPDPAALVGGQAASDLIRRGLEGDAPSMVARFGSSELGCVLTHIAMTRRASRATKAVDYVRGRAAPFWWSGVGTAVCYFSGVFPCEPAILSRYAELTLADTAELDVLASWLPGERQLGERLDGVQRVPLRDLEPYYHENPWSAALAGRTVLVVHPFEQSIRDQYARRRELFSDPRVLPDFELKTLRAVQSIAGAKTPYASWFDAYDHMCEAIAATEFDIALIGCGAYGFPLAAHVKRLGKHAVHLGGATQYLFGIRGRDADKNPGKRAIYTDAWVRPREDERPENYLTIEGGRYW